MVVSLFSKGRHFKLTRPSPARGIECTSKLSGILEENSQYQTGGGEGSFCDGLVEPHNLNLEYRLNLLLLAS